MTTRGYPPDTSGNFRVAASYGAYLISSAGGELAPGRFSRPSSGQSPGLGAPSRPDPWGTHRAAVHARGTSRHPLQPRLTSFLQAMGDPTFVVSPHPPFTRQAGDTIDDDESSYVGYNMSHFSV